MKCPCCGEAELVHDTRDVPYTYKGESTIIPLVTGDYCLACGELLLNREEGDRYSDLTGQFNRQVNASFVDPGFIVKVRKKLELNQKQATDLFGGGINAFSRYETGKARPSVALVKLLKLLDLHPDLFNEVKLL
jgi:HTH-type transcriptional regulator/antitoxin MqsA